MASSTPRPPLLPWSASTWADRWSTQGRLSSTPVPRTPFLLLKAPVSTLYEEKFGGDRNMFTVAMYCSRMMARSIRIGLVIDCTSLDLEEFEPLPAAKASSTKKSDRRIRYFHNPSEWDDYDVEYHRLLPPIKETGYGPLAPQLLSEFYRTISNYLQKSRSGTNASDNSKVHIALFDSRGGLGAAAYLAAAYMCHNLRAPVHAAIEAVKEGTPAQVMGAAEDKDKKWGLCDVRLVNDLQSRFKGRREIKMEGGTPAWWWALDEDDGDDEDSDEDDEDALKAKLKRKREEVVLIPPCDSSAEDDRSKRARTDGGMTSSNGNNDIYPNLPKEILEPVAKDSQRWTRALTVLSQMTTTPSASGPPAATTLLPLKPEVDVSTDNTDADLLQLIKNNSDKYKVTWRSTKGRRGLLLILAEAVYFMEQSSPTSEISISVVTKIKFPSHKDMSKSQHRTLLDVVLVKDTERGRPTFRFYALDILCIEGGMVWHKPFEHRWRFLNDGVLIPRKKDEARQVQQQQSSSHVYAKEPIKIRAKEYFAMKKLGFVMKDVCAGVGHEAEGVRVVPMGEYGIGAASGDNNDSERKESAVSVVWSSGGSVDGEQLKALLLA